jgi:hypothetical protein
LTTDQIARVKSVIHAYAHVFEGHENWTTLRTSTIALNIFPIMEVVTTWFGSYHKKSRIHLESLWHDNYCFKTQPLCVCEVETGMQRVTGQTSSKPARWTGRRPKAEQRVVVQFAGLEPLVFCFVGGKECITISRQALANDGFRI